MAQKEKLFNQFPPVTNEEWMNKIHSDLKGADFNKKMVWKTEEGFDVKPFYRMEDIENLYYSDTLPGQFPYIRGVKTRDNNWFVRQNIEVSDYSEANRKALDVLMKGVDSLGFIISDPESVSLENFNTLLKGIHFAMIELNFLCNGKASEILDIITTISKERGLTPEGINGAIETDPLGRLMLNGKLCINVEDGFDYLASLTESASRFPDLRTIHLNAAHFNNSGADIVRELAFGISMGNEYMVQLTQRGINAGVAASSIRFSFGIGSNYFAEIAKLRAARLLWSAVQKGFQQEDYKGIKMYIHCVTSEWNKTIYDPYMNMLRTQTEAMAAILGGTDSLTVEPFDIVFRQPGEFSERIARNQQLILKEEAYFDKVIDPAAGSYYIENLTGMITDKAWKLFLEAEEIGGFLSCLKSGFVQKNLSESAARRKKEISNRKLILLGTNQYPDSHEKISSSVDLNKIFNERIYEKDLVVDAITPFRGSEEYEKLRIAVDRSSFRPVVFLLPVGNHAMRKARSQFSMNFFECAGYNVIDNYGFNTAEEGITNAIESEADIVVICSSDEEYSLFAPGIYKRLKDKAIVVVAGNPPCIDELKAKGMDHFIYSGLSVVDTLNKFNEQMGIAPEYDQKKNETKVQI
jgi:methylmalonyl-CoA mutase